MMTVFDLITNLPYTEKNTVAATDIAEVCKENPQFARGYDVYQHIFTNARHKWIGVAIRTGTPDSGTMLQKFGIVRHLLPIIDETTTTFRLLCEEDMLDQRNGRTGGWFIAHPDLVTIVNEEPLDGPINFQERIMCYDPAYRQKLKEQREQEE